MNDQLISRNALKKAIDTIKQIGYDTENKPLFDYVELPDLIKIIDHAPTVETYSEEDMCDTTSNGFDIGYDFAKAKYERPQGEWIDHENHIECNKCQVWFLKDHLIRKSFCPNCGAEMMKGGVE